MGNCMETCAQENIRELDHHHDHQDQTTVIIDDDHNIEGSRSGLRVKIVLTREELEWLLFQLQLEGNKGGGGTNSIKRLEDVLGEMEIGSSKMVVFGHQYSDDHEDSKRWKPSLDSIMETPEAVEIVVMRERNRLQCRVGYQNARMVDMVITSVVGMLCDLFHHCEYTDVWTYLSPQFRVGNQTGRVD
ncbi:hypothetical protein Sjap_005351 [Stephania japonica]|uniref:Uncharacterized protein n=1 Tax=Stephania japonica TaxID=461633 RepID=A0AAP0PHS4_9MAGN